MTYIQLYLCVLLGTFTIGIAISAIQCVKKYRFWKAPKDRPELYSSYREEAFEEFQKNTQVSVFIAIIWPSSVPVILMLGFIYGTGWLFRAILEKILGEK